MKVGNYALYDKVQGVYVNGVQMNSDVVYKRMLELALVRGHLDEYTMRHPEDFFAVYLGDFESSYGVFESREPKVLFCLASLSEKEEARALIPQNACKDLQEVLTAKYLNYGKHMKEEEALQQAREEVVKRLAAGKLSPAQEMAVINDDNLYQNK